MGNICRGGNEASEVATEVKTTCMISSSLCESINSCICAGSCQPNTLAHMEEPSSFSSPKFSKASSVNKRGGKGAQALPFRHQTEQQQRGQAKEQALVRKVRESVAKAKHRVPIAQALPSTTEKPQNLPKPAVKEQTRPVNFKLHTEERAARRAGFNYLVANKIYSLELLRRFEEKIQKVIEEEEIKMLRKEMVPKAQLMPFFDRPFLPQRSRRPLTVPKEPRVLQRKSCGGDEGYKYYQQFFGQQMKAIR